MFLFEPSLIKIKTGKRIAIYGILNLINGKIYIGSAVNFKARFRQHKCDLRLNKHINKHLQRAWNGDGESNFKFSILEIVDDKYTLLEREQYWINLTGCNDNNLGYNFKAIAGSSLGVKHSEETKIKISKATKGKKKARISKKWIHPWGRKCPCLECKTKRNNDMKAWRANRA